MDELTVAPADLGERHTTRAAVLTRSRYEFAFWEMPARREA
jgi:hypothetical protein